MGNFQLYAEALELGAKVMVMVPVGLGQLLKSGLQMTTVLHLNGAGTLVVMVVHGGQLVAAGATAEVGAIFSEVGATVAVLEGQGQTEVWMGATEWQETEVTHGMGHFFSS